MDGQIPPPPDGYTLQDSSASNASIPPPPPGYQLQGSAPTPVGVGSQATQGDALWGNGSTAPRSADESLFQKVNDFGNDLGDATLHNLGNLPVGIAQLAAHGVRSLADAGASTAAPDSIGAKIAGYVGDKVNAMDNSIANRESTYQAAVPTNTASVIGATLGNVLPFLVGGEVTAAPKAATLLGKIGIGAATGGGIAATQPVTSGAQQGQLAQQITGDQTPSFAKQKAEQIGIGALTGGAIPLAAGAARGINALAQHVYAPETIAANNLARTLQATPDTVNKLASYVAPITGESPTTAQVIGGPRAAMVEKAASNNPGFKLALTENQNNNNAARLSLLQDLAGTPEKLQQAIETRRASVQPFVDASLQPATPAIRYAAAQTPIADALSKPMVRNADWRALNDANSVLQKVRTGTMQEDDALEELGHIAATTKQGGNAQQAIQDSLGAINHNMIDPSSLIKQLKNVRNSSSFGQNDTVRNALDKIAGRIQEAQNINGLVPANLLEGIRQNAGNILNSSTTGTNVVGTTETAGLAPIKQGITELLHKNVPGFGDYLANYAKHSAPINDMQLAQRALDSAAMRRNNTADMSQLNLSDINKVLRGSSAAQYGLSDAALKKIQALQDSLKSTDVANMIKNPGSDTNYNAQAQGWLAKQMLGSDLSGTSNLGRGASAVVGGVLGEHFGGPGGAAAGTAAGAFINKAANFVNDRIMAAYTKGLLDPATAKEMLTNYLHNNQKQAPALLQKFPAWQALLSAPAARITNQSATP